MVNIDKDSLEKALNSKSKEKETSSETQMSKEEAIGFHKGSLSTLSGERIELIKMIGNVEAIMQAHIKSLEELGIKINTGKN